MASILEKLSRKVKRLLANGASPVETTNSTEVSPEKSLRRQLADRYLSGNGIEVGALHSPLEVSPNAIVRYVDRMAVPDLRQQYPELAGYELVEVDIIDDGEILSSIADSSLDFVIANHMIEHCQNPIGTIEQHLRVLKPGGILYMAVPDKRYTFDRDRPVTSLEHLIRDYTEGSEWSKQSHFEEWSRLVDKVPEEQVAAHSQNRIEINYSIHFHVWTQAEFMELLLYCQRDLAFSMQIEVLQQNDYEFIAILKKTQQPEYSRSSIQNHNETNQPLNILDQYIKSPYNPQDALDIFKGEWSSKLPQSRGDLSAGSIPLFEDKRIAWAVEQLGGVEGKTVFELGPLEAGHSYMLEQHGAAEIVSIEANSRAFLKCLIVKEVLNLKRVNFLYGDCVEYLRSNSKKFDVCIASGVLYHMRNPVELLDLLSQVSDRVFLWTHYYDQEIISSKAYLAPRFSSGKSAEYSGFQHTLYKQQYNDALNWAGFCGGSEAYSHWLSREDILACLKHFGFQDIHINFDTPDHPNGPSFALTAVR